MTRARSLPGEPALLRILGYTRGVKSFRQGPLRGSLLVTPAVLISALLIPSPALAGDPKTDAETARAVGRAARNVAEAADKVADAQSADAADTSTGGPFERARQGVVVLERGGKVIGVGSVLDGDGRILTALSSLAHGNAIDARYADGSVARVKVGHSDRAWDLALLVPQNSRWRKGLRASRTEALASGANLRTFGLVGERALAVTRTIVKGQGTLLGGDSELLRDALELASQFKPTEIGAPIVNDAGEVVAIVARACAANSGPNCVALPFGVPVSALKAFLRTVPANAVPPAPWLGIQGVAEDAGPVRGVRVSGVNPRSPAAAAGLKAGSSAKDADVVIAVDGLPVGTPEALSDTINRRAVGDSVELLLFGNGKFRRVSLVLRAAPEDKPRAATPAAKLSTPSPGR
jgi:serine protease Do